MSAGSVYRQARDRVAAQAEFDFAQGLGSLAAWLRGSRADNREAGAADLHSPPKVDSSDGPTVLRILLGFQLRRLRESRGIAAKAAMERVSIVAYEPQDTPRILAEIIASLQAPHDEAQPGI